DLLPVLHLVPEGLQHLPEERGVGILPVHQLADVGEAHVPPPELRVGQHAEPAAARRLVSLEGEVHLVDAMALRGGAERRLGAPLTAAEENAVLAPHVLTLPGDFSRTGLPASTTV